jgi:hypothetical protein
MEGGCHVAAEADAMMATEGNAVLEIQQASAAGSEEQTGDHLGTPMSVLAVVAELGAIALDPCSNRWSIVRAAVELDGSSLEQDGLAADWHALARGGLIFVSPPCGREQMKKWAPKVISMAQAGCEIVVLVKCDHSTKWWRALRRSAPAVCYWSERIVFRGSGRHGANFPSALFYFGRRAHLFAHVFSAHGDVRVLR